MTAIDMDPIEQALTATVVRALLELAKHKQVEPGVWIQFSTYFRMVASDTIDTAAMTMLEQEPGGRLQ